jgi:hypothetical protein
VGLDGTRHALMMRAMDDVAGEAAQRHASPSAAMGTDLSNRRASTALVLGITSIVLIPAFAIGSWASLGEVELDPWVLALYFISLVAAISASLFGVEGRRLAKAGAPGRNCHAAYLKARPSVRRRFNSALLEAVCIRDRKIGRANFSEVFAPLFSRPSSNKRLKVDPRGLEPLTFWLPARQA